MTEQPIELSSLIQQAQQAYEGKDFSRSAELFRGIEGQLVQQGNLTQAAEMANNRCVALLQSGKPAEALEAARSTEHIFANAGDLRHQAMACANQAAALVDLKRSDEALTLYQKSVDLFTQIGENEMQSVVLQSISSIFFHKMDFISALSIMVDALNLQSHLGVKERVLKWFLGVACRVVK